VDYSPSHAVPPTIINGTATGRSFVLDSGVDTANNDAWTVINHNSQLAVVPEPSSLIVAAFGLLGLAGFGVRRRSRRQVVC